MKIVGKHVYGNLYECEADLSNENFLQEIIIKAVEISNSKLEKLISYKFGKGFGVSIIAIVSESHISIHTWPEYNYATVDVYTCGNHTEPEKAFDYIVKELKPKKITKHIVDRSLE
ncbi:MAG: adenosylmethionine decarboxylase [Candidatus Aenigmatarchaeota archaeon]